jgi:uncharacterized protein DUF397
MTDLSQATWRKAERSNGANTGCVEVAFGLPQMTALRDSTRPDAGVLVVRRDTFAALLEDIRAGRYDV